MVYSFAELKIFSMHIMDSYTGRGEILLLWQSHQYHRGSATSIHKALSASSVFHMQVVEPPYSIHGKACFHQLLQYVLSSFPVEKSDSQSLRSLGSHF